MLFHVYVPPPLIDYAIIAAPAYAVARLYD